MTSQPPIEGPHTLDLSGVSTDWKVIEAATFMAQRLAGIEYQLMEQNRLMADLLRAMKDRFSSP